MTDLSGAPQPTLRPAVLGATRYRPGRSPAPVEAGGSHPLIDPFKLSSNENPYPPLPAVLDVVTAAATQMNRYPDNAAVALVDTLAGHLGVPPAHVAVGCGSVGVLGQIVYAAAGPGDEVVFAWRSFEAYPMWTQLSGATAVPVPLTPDARHDLEAMAAAVTPRTRLVLVCSPNNPTGTAVRRDELKRFLDAVPPTVLTVIDEAYCEFIRDDDVPDALDLYRDRPNVVVLRTFSKAYGLAGLRIGYAVAHEPVADAIRATATPFGVSGVAQAAAIASLQPPAQHQLLDRVEALVVERERVVAALTAQGWALPDAHGNFVWLPLGEQSQAFADACEAEAISVRPYAPDGVRVTIGETEANDRFLRIAAAWRSHPPHA